MDREGQEDQRRAALLVMGAVLAGLLAMRAAAPFVAPPAAVEVPAVRPAAATVSRPAVLEGDRHQAVRGRGRRAAAGRRGPPQPAAGGPARRGHRADNGLVGRDGAVVAVRGGVACATPGRSGRLATPPRPSLLRRRLGQRRPGLAGGGDRRPRALVPAARSSWGSGSWEGVAATAAATGAPPPAAAGGPGYVAARAAAAGRGGRRGARPRGRAGGRVRGVEPRTGWLGRRLGLAATIPLTAVAARGSAVAWVEGSALHLGDLASGRPGGGAAAGDRRVRGPWGVLAGRADPGRGHQGRLLHPPSPGPGRHRPGLGGPGWPVRKGRCPTAAPPAWPGRRPATGSSSAASALGSASAPTGSAPAGP